MILFANFYFFFFSRRSRHTRSKRDWSSDVSSPDRASSSLVTIGEPGEELARRARDAGLQKVERAADLADAVRKAAVLAAPGSVVLLSPAFTSYDMFRDYEDRGRRFKATVLAELGR